jgi:hypothetical protein
MGEGGYMNPGVAFGDVKVVVKITNARLPVCPFAREGKGPGVAYSLSLGVNRTLSSICTQRITSRRTETFLPSFMPREL